MNSNILVVDDDPITIQLLGHILSDLGTLRFATSGEDAVRLARESSPDLMLLDLKMPKMDGLEVLRHVKADPRLRRLPIVVLTSSREESDIVRSYDLGVNAYVVKPVKFSDFVEAVRALGAFWAVLNEMPPPS